MKKRALALFMSVLMVLSLVHVGIIAEDSNAILNDPDINLEDPVVFTKTLIPATADSPAMIELEAYTTGSVETGTGAVPTDIVLVLDQSGSMDDTVGGVTKLALMKNAVEEFLSEVAAMNNTAGDLYRVAVVGFASESGYSDNSEILTATKTETVTSTTYTVVAGSLDTDMTYYIRDGQAYRAIAYRDYGRYSGWYTTGRNPQYINVNNSTIYTRSQTTATETSYGVPFNDLTDSHYENALVNCTADTIAANGTLGLAVDALDGNGATRTDLGLEMAYNIFGAQPAGTYDDRSKVVVLITDGVPTTQSTFNSTIANYAVSYAKDMKDDGAHIFSMYLGTPAAESVNFLQACSSNYPDASSITSLGEQAATSYYSAHTDSSAIQNMFTGIVNAITVQSTLNEKSVVTDSLTEYFKLAADLSSTGTSQVEVYTVDMTADGWASEKVPFDNAKVTIGGQDNKTISVTGFNFAAHCVTAVPKGGAGSTDYGRKLVINIPIAEDDNADTMGGWLPTNTTAGIYQDADAVTPTITADGKFMGYPLFYTMNGTERAFHVDDTQLSMPVEYTVSFNEIADGVLDEMLTMLPDGNRNDGVTITYKLYDIGTNDKATNDRNDDVLVAELTVPAGSAMDVTDSSEWTWYADKAVMTIPAEQYMAEKVYVLVCTLTSTETDENPDKLTVYDYLDLSVVRGDLAHIVYGAIDAGGTIHVSDGAPGILTGNTYTEAVTANENSATMTFAPTEGNIFYKIIYKTSAEEPFDTAVLIYSESPDDVVVDVDLDGDGTVDPVTFNADGEWIFTAYNVTSGVAVEVSTKTLMFKLTTGDDNGSEIIDDTEYRYDAVNPLNVPFRAFNGYYLSALEVNGVVYDLTNDRDLDALADTYEGEFSIAYDADGTEIVVGGHVNVPRTQDNEVYVTSALRSYNVTLKYYIQNADGTYTEQIDMTEGPVAVPYGTKISNTVHPAYMPGEVEVFDGENYTLSDWYKNYTGSEFYGLMDLTEAVMPASDLTLYAVWTENPDVTVATLNIEKHVEGTHSADSVFRFQALFHEHSAGTAEITIPANSDVTVTEEMSIVLTDFQMDSFMAGNGSIYIYELEGTGDGVWIYDNTRYELKWDRDNNQAVLYLDNTALTGDTVSFTNKIITPGLNVSKTVENITTGNNTAKPGDELTYTITVRNIGNVDLSNVKVEDRLENAAGSISFDSNNSNVTYSNGVFLVKALGVNDSEVIEYTYTVLPADAGKTISNEAVVVSHHPSNPDGDETTETKVSATVTYEYTGEVPAGLVAPVDDNSPYFAGDPVTVLDHPTEVPGYTFVGWYDGDVRYDGADTFTMPDRDVILEGKWSSNNYTITVNYFIEDTTTALKDPVTVTRVAKYGDTYNVADQIPVTIEKDGNNYCWTSNSAAVEDTVTDNVVINAYYAIDNWDDEEDKPTGGDEIPDKYQAYIVYKVVGGTWDGEDKADKGYVVTLKEKNQQGEWNAVIPVPVFGDYTPDVTNAQPDADHTTPAYWSPVPYAEEVVPAGESVFTYIFTNDQALTFTFDANGGAWEEAVAGYTMNTANTLAEKTVSFGGKVAQIGEEPVREGYEFTGWFSKNSSGDLTAKWWPVAGIEYDVYEDTIVYANWKEVEPTNPPATRKGTLYVNLQDENGTYLGGTDDGIEITDEAYEVSAEAGADYVIPGSLDINGTRYIYEGPTDYSAALTGTVSRDGEIIVVILQYTIDNWNDEDDELTGGDEIPDKYQVCFEYVSEDTNKGTVSPEMEVITIADNAASGTVIGDGSKVTVNRGFAFNEWVTESGAAFKKDNEETGKVTLENAEGGKTYTFTATFSSVKFIVSYDLNGGEGAWGVDYSPVTVPAGEQVVVKKAPSKPLSIFLGFEYNGRLYEPGDVITVYEDVELVAQWSIIPILPDNQGSAELIKVDAADSTITIPNVVFQLYRVSDGRLIGTYKTDEDGEIDVKNLVPGKYYWVEKQPAEGYKLDDTKYMFTVRAFGITSITVTNERAEVPVVFTGDHFAYIIGYNDGTVRPEGNITRAEVATIFFRLLDDQVRNRYITRSNNFSDVEEGMWFNTAISTMAAMGIVNGYPDGSFKPDENITRAEFTAIAARFDTSGNTTGASFMDIYDHWAKREIDIAINNGWVLGYEDGTFRPDQYITRAESMALVNRVLQRIPETVDDLLPDMNIWPDNSDIHKWYYLTVQEATNSHYYERKVNGYEYWTARKEDPDWTMYEN